MQNATSCRDSVNCECFLCFNAFLFRNVLNFILYIDAHILVLYVFVTLLFA